MFSHEILAKNRSKDVEMQRQVSSDGRTSLRVPAQGFVALHHGARQQQAVSDSEPNEAEKKRKTMKNKEKTMKKQ